MCCRTPWTGIDGLVVPPVHRCAFGQAILRGCVTAPFLLRPSGSHGGAGLRRIESWDSFDEPAACDAAWYVSPFVDSRGADGFYRKYRMAFVDRRPFAYHLAISRDWLVHYFSADMQAHAWKLAEEAAFLADPRSALGPRAYDAIEAVGNRLDLDFCGIDFTLLPDGRALVFEANATMLIHPESDTGNLTWQEPARSTHHQRHVRTHLTDIKVFCFFFSKKKFFLASGARMISQEHVTPDTLAGATLIEDGASFKVWAPRANAVYLNGVFSGVAYDVQGDDRLLIKDEAGYWTGFHAGAVDGDRYRYWIDGEGSSGYKRDPRARELDPAGFPGLLCHPARDGRLSLARFRFSDPGFFRHGDLSTAHRHLCH